MTTIQDIPWPRVFAESAVIVASILLALWVDAWWSNRQERLDEIVVLNALRTELGYFIQFREAERKQAIAIQESAEKLLAFARNPTDEISDQQIDAWLSDTTWYTNTGGEPTPVAQSLVSGGRLGLISNRELRAMILTWPFSGSGFAAVAKRDLDFVDQQYLPYLREHASITQIYAADDGQPGNEAQTFPLSVADDEYDAMSHKDMILDMEFRNLLIDRISLLYEFQNWYQVIDDIPTLEEGLELLTAEIEEQDN